MRDIQKQAHRRWNIKFFTINPKQSGKMKALKHYEEDNNATEFEILKIYTFHIRQHNNDLEYRVYHKTSISLDRLMQSSKKTRLCAVGNTTTW